MIDFIEKEFSYLLEKDYHGKVEEITYVFKNIIYYKPNIKIVVSCELIENQFDFEVWVKNNNKEYSICEQEGRMRLYYQNQGALNIIHKDIFEYTAGIWSVETFQIKKEEVYKKNSGFNKGKKILLEFISLYKELLEVAIENIEIFFNIH